MKDCLVAFHEVVELHVLDFPLFMGASGTNHTHGITSFSTGRGILCCLSNDHHVLSSHFVQGSDGSVEFHTSMATVGNHKVSENHVSCFFSQEASFADFEGGEVIEE